MPRPGIKDLDRPERAYRPDLACPLDDGTHFETINEAVEEDQERRRLTRTCGEQDLFDPAAAENLAYCLDYESRGIEPPQTLASYLNFRQHRIRVAGHLWQLVDEVPWETSTFSIIPRGWNVTPQQLPDFHPVSRLEAFKAALYRNGARDAGGFLSAFIHSEFEPTSQRFQMHLHGLAAGGMIDVLDNLRATPTYRSVRSGEHSWEEPQRITISREPLYDLPYPITYQLQSFWPCRRIGEVGDDGRIMRNRHRMRVPEPFHTQYLLWLDRWSLSDISLLVGLSVRDGAFAVRNAYTNGGQ